MQSLLRTIPESRKFLESIRGKHRRTGSLWYPNLVDHLEDPDEGSSRWWDKTEFLALAAIYCERRSRGSILQLAGASDLVSLVAKHPKLSAEGKYRLYRLLACPLLVNGSAQYHYTRYRSVQEMSRYGWEPDIQFPLRNVMCLFSVMLPVLTATNRDTLSAFHDCLVSAWLEFHKEIWDIQPDGYLSNLTLSAWNNVQSSGLILNLIREFNNVERNGYGISSWAAAAGLTTEKALEDTIEFINGLSSGLGVSLEDLELNRVFGDYLRGAVSADELPATVTIWRGVKDTAFSDAIKALLKTPALLKLVSKKHMVEALLGKQTRASSIRDLLVTAVPGPFVDKFLVELSGQGLDATKVRGLLASHQFANWRSVIGNTGYYDEESTMVQRDLMGVRAFLIDALTPTSELYAKIAAEANAWLATAGLALGTLLAENSVHIKLAKKLFDNVASKLSTQRSSAASIRLDCVPDADTLAYTTVPSIAVALYTDFENKLQDMVSEKISDLVDDDWKRLETTEIRFDD